MSLPYATATAGNRALCELQSALSHFGCKTFGSMMDEERGLLLVQFTWRERRVSIEASWRGYAAAWLKENPWSARRRSTRQEWEAEAVVRGRAAVCSILRDWIKAQVAAMEAGLLSFDAAFLPHMLLPDGRRVVDYVDSSKLLGAPS